MPESKIKTAAKATSCARLLAAKFFRKSISKSRIKIPTVGRYRRCSKNSEARADSGRINDGMKKPAAQKNPNKMKLIRFSFEKIKAIKITTIAAAPYIIVV